MSTNPQKINFEDFLKVYMISPYVSGVKEEIENSFPKDILEEVPAEMHAYNFLGSFYESPDVYKTFVGEFNKNINVGTLERTLQQSILKTQDAFLRYLTVNEELVNELSKVAYEKGIENLTENDKYDVIRNRFKTPQEYIEHVQIGLEAYAQNNFIIMQTIINPQDNKFMKNIEMTNKLLQAYSEALIKEAENIYGVKFVFESGATDDYSSDSGKKAA